MVQTKQQISITLNKRVLAIIDNARGTEGRSSYIERLLTECSKAINVVLKEEEAAQ